MSGWQLVDQQRWRLQVHGRRIPAAALGLVSDSQALVAQANDVWQTACQDAEQIKHSAREQGFAQGLQDAHNQVLDTLLQTQQAMQHQAAASEQRVVDLAYAVLGKLLPRLAEQEVMSELLATALREVRAERFLRIRVHPAVVESVHQRLGEWRYQAYAVPAVEVLADPGLSRWGCVVESELGTLIAGLDVQLEAIHASLRAAAAASDHAQSQVQRQVSSHE